MNRSRFFDATRRTLLGAAVAVAALTAAALPADASGPRAAGSGPLSDLQPSLHNPTDGARGWAKAVSHHGTTGVVLVVHGLDPASAGVRLGAHVHVGPCVAGNGGAAGPHYNAGGGVNEHTEVWLDLDIRPSGVAQSHTIVPFAIPEGGARSIVIHELATNPTTGAAGPRLACLPFEF